MPTEANLTLRHAQGQVFSSTARFRVLVAGRRFGKSYLSCIELLRGAINKPGETYFYCAPTYRMAKDIAWKLLKQLVPKQWLKSKNESDLKIELVNGSMIELKGTENAMALRGRSLSGVVLDEAAFMDPGVWFEVLRPALADKQGWALFISTPKAPHHGFTTSGTTRKKTVALTGSAGATPPSKAETSPQMKWRLHVHNLTQEHSAKNLRRPSRTYPASSPSISLTRISKKP